MKLQQRLRLDLVYGIVTNYVSWIFFSSRSDNVTCEGRYLCLLPEGPERESLKVIVEKIYSMLSD